MFFISYGTRTGPVRDPQGCRTAALRTRKAINTTRIGKTPARASYLALRGPYGPLTGPAGAVHGLFTISKSVRARKLIMHTLKLYGPVRGGKIRTAPHGVRAGPVSGRTIFVQNSPGTARTGPGSVMWLRHYAACAVHCVPLILLTGQRIYSWARGHSHCNQESHRWR